MIWTKIACKQIKFFKLTVIAPIQDSMYMDQAVECEFV